MGNEIIWLTEYRTFGIMLRRGAYTSAVQYKDPKTGEQVQEEIENNEIKEGKIVDSDDGGKN